MSFSKCHLAFNFNISQQISIQDHENESQKPLLMSSQKILAEMDGHGFFFVIMQSLFTKTKYLDLLPSVKTQGSQWLLTSCFAAAARSKLGQASVSSDTLTNSLFITKLCVEISLLNSFMVQGKFYLIWLSLLQLCATSARVLIHCSLL